MALHANVVDSRQALYNRLISDSGMIPNAHYLATMLSSFVEGESALPAQLGLDEAELDNILSYFFPKAQSVLPDMAGRGLDLERQDEFDELLSLLLSHRANASAFEEQFAKIITSGCMGSDHLWQDLGLWSRKDLSEMLMHNFPALASKNTKNMKWKRFFYKQLCDAEGIYVCRSPSCEVCTDYKVCFSPED